MTTFKHAFQYSRSIKTEFCKKTFNNEQHDKKDILRNCGKVLESLKVQGFELIMFTALLYRNGKKLNSIEKANTEYFAELMRNYDKSEEPDKVKVEFRNCLYW